MKKYNVIFSIDAKFDIADLKRYIKHELKAPDTAANYIRELNTTIQGLSSYADSIGINEYIQSQFGTNARHIIFKK
jgi:plasmid stabilization system protein ParE